MSDAAANDGRNDLLLSDHDEIVRLTERSEANARRIKEIVDWKHDQLPPVIVDLQKSVLALNKDTAAVKGEVSALCVTVNKMAEMVAALLPLPKEIAEHKDDCSKLARENIRHSEGFEARVTALFDKGETARGELAKKVDGIRSWVISGLVTTLLALLGGSLTVIWAAIQHGGLALFHS